MVRMLMRAWQIVFLPPTRTFARLERLDHDRGDGADQTFRVEVQPPADLGVRLHFRPSSLPRPLLRANGFVQR